jgi:hypothetical protein
MGLRRLAPLLLALAIVASSCGGNGTVFDTSTTKAPPGAGFVDAEISGVAEAIVADLGPEPGMLAVGYALDRGYTAGQIADGGLSGDLRADGRINGVQPALPLWGIFADLPPADGSGTGGGARTASRVLGFAHEPNPYDVPIRADQYLAALGIEFEAVMSGRPTTSAPSAGEVSTTTTDPPAPGDPEQATIMIGLIIDLSDLGYSAEQIILGIVLGEVRMTMTAGSLGAIGCWVLEDSADGSVIPPALPVLPGAFADAGQCREEIDRLTATGTDDSTTTSTTTTSTTTTTDAHGIQDGLYVGEVYVIGEPSPPIFEIPESAAELEVTDDGIVATVDYVQRWAYRGTGPAGQGMDQVLCVATISMLYFGEGPATNPLSLAMQPVTQEIVSLEGPHCGIGEGFDYTVESALLANFAEEQTRTLTGSFSDGCFEGNMGEVHGVAATRVEE